MKKIQKSLYSICLAAVIVACGVISPKPNNSQPPIMINIVTVTKVPSVVPPNPTSFVDSATLLPTFAGPLNPKISLKARIMGAPQYSPDNKWLFLPTKAGVFVLDAASYQVTRLLAYAPDYISEVVLSPDGKILAFENTLISTIDGQELFSPKIPPSIQNGNSYGAIKVIKFSPDNKLLAAIYYLDQVDVWSMEDSKLLYSLPAESVDFSPDSVLIAVGFYLDGNPHIQLYDAQTGNFLKDWAGVRAEFLNAHQLAVETIDGATRVYDLLSGKVPYAFSGKYAAFSSDERLVALLFLDRMEIHQVTDGKLLHKLEGDFRNVQKLDLRFAPDGETLAGYAYWSFCCGGSADRLSLWRVDEGALIKEIRNFFHYNFSADGSSLVITSEEGLQILEISDGSIRVELDELTAP